MQKHSPNLVRPKLVSLYGRDIATPLALCSTTEASSVLDGAPISALFLFCMILIQEKQQQLNKNTLPPGGCNLNSMTFFYRFPRVCDPWAVVLLARTLVTFYVLGNFVKGILLNLPPAITHAVLR